MIPPLLAGRVAAVTGGAGGLGGAIAAMLEVSGATVARLDVVAGKGVIPCDVTDERSIRDALAAAARDGRLDIVVANAGVVPPWRETEELDLEAFDRTLAVNVSGVAATFKHAVPFLKERGGALVATGSIMGYRAHARQAAYVASKHAVVGLVKAAALDLGRYGIRDNAVAPGAVATDALLARMDWRAEVGLGPARAKALAAAAQETALGRMTTADDVARTVLWLASDLSAGVTGQLVPVEGGLA
jgi:NAD(P)-dependent dehydrogenase (short-subunit alcohol dehydrogenase family)